MTQEDKQLLLVDLCARLPYGVKIELTWWVMGEGMYINTTLEPDHIEQLLNDEDGDTEIKPYLRPMSSMTDEEWNDLVMEQTCGDRERNMVARFDWLNKKMFDYRGLIPKGLANSTEKFNPYKYK